MVGKGVNKPAQLLAHALKRHRYRSYIIIMMQLRSIPASARFWAARPRCSLRQPRFPDVDRTLFDDGVLWKIQKKPSDEFFG